MFMSTQIIYYRADTGLAALILSTWRCWLSWHIFLFTPLRRRCQANCWINCPTCDGSHVVAVWRFPQCDARPLHITFPGHYNVPNNIWSPLCPQIIRPFPVIQLAQEARGESA